MKVMVKGALIIVDFNNREMVKDDVEPRTKL